MQEETMVTLTSKFRLAREKYAVCVYLSGILRISLYVLYWLYFIWSFS